MSNCSGFNFVLMMQSLVQAFFTEREFRLCSEERNISFLLGISMPFITTMLGFTNINVNSQCYKTPVTSENMFGFDL